MHKLLLGTPFYGRSFTLTEGSSNPGASSTGDGGTPGKYTEEAGFLSYYEICLLKKEGGWTEKTDSDGNPYMFKVINLICCMTSQNLFIFREINGLDMTLLQASRGK